MPTLDQISAKILSAQLYHAELTKTAVGQESVGNNDNNWNQIICLQDYIEALTTQVLLPDYTSSTTQTLYEKLSSIVGLRYIDGAALDPDAQQTPGVIFIGNQSPQTVSYEVIEFTNQTTIALTSYHAIYYPRYGNNPQVQIYVSNGAGGFNPDYGTSPTYDYTIPGDETSGIASITWGYGVATSGYISIFGVNPTT